MHKLKNCSSCGKIFMDFGGCKMCLDCLREWHDEENVVMRFVRDHPTVDVKTISESTCVGEKHIMQMIRNGCFIDKKSYVYYPCGTCGRPITAGKVCSECSGKLVKQMNEMNARSIRLNSKPAERKVVKGSTFSMLRDR